MRRSPILLLPQAITKGITPIVRCYISRVVSFAIGCTDNITYTACSTTVTVALSFGGNTWPISPNDFKLTEISSGQCLGSVFIFSATANSPAWIVGDTFLKNVYTVFRANPASVGFAQLAVNVQTLVAAGGVPTPTIGSVSASVTGSGQASSGATLPMISHLALLICAMGASLVYLL
jgi:hypothetical protein